MTPYDNPDYHALVARIRDIDRGGGDSTLARLVTADWLQDHGEEERAEFIRVQCEQRQGPVLCRAERCADLLRAHGEKWLPPAVWPPHDPLRAGGTVWQGLYSHFGGGFVERVHCPLVAWLEHGPDVCRRHPVRQVVITDVVPGDMREFITLATPLYEAVRVESTYVIHSHDLYRLVGATTSAHPLVKPLRAVLKRYGVEPLEVIPCYATAELAAQAFSAAALEWAEASIPAPAAAVSH